MQYLYAAGAIAIWCLSSSVVTVLVLQYARISLVPKEIPWVDLRGKRWLPKFRATFHQLATHREPIDEGWEKVRKRVVS